MNYDNYAGAAEMFAAYEWEVHFWEAKIKGFVDFFFFNQPSLSTKIGIWDWE